MCDLEGLFLSRTRSGCPVLWAHTHAHACTHMHLLTHTPSPGHPSGAGSAEGAGLVSVYHVIAYFSVPAVLRMAAASGRESSLIRITHCR